MNHKGVTMAAAVLVLAGLLVWFFSSGPRPAPMSRPAPAEAPRPARPRAAPPAPLPPPPPAPPAEGCAGPERFAAAAAANAASLSSLAWSPFRRAEVGWEAYAPFVAREVATRCSPADAGFAQALSLWQSANKRPVTGVLAPEDFEIMRVASHRRRPFVLAFAQGCPPGAEPASLALVGAGEGYAGKAVSLRRDVLDAYRRMRAAARAEIPALADDPRLLTVFSGYRSPVEEAVRCVGRDCTGVSRALCSAHRTGTALDLYVGGEPASTEPANRLAQSRNPAYRWLVANGARFGFVPYVFEPWHWEWTGGPPLTRPSSSSSGREAIRGTQAAR